MQPALKSHPFLGSKQRAAQLQTLSPAKHDGAFYIPPVAPSKLTKFSKSTDLPTPQQQQQHNKQQPPPQPKKKKKPQRAAVNQLDGAELWLNQKSNASFEDISVKLAPLNRTKEFAHAGAADRPQMTPLEVDVMRKIVVRENLLVELKRLIDNQTDVGNVVLEVVELVKAIRFQTLDVVEDISSWIHAQPNKRPFLYRGANYLVKLCNDLDFMDSHDEIVERFCFEFKMNPLAYRGGGNIIVGFGASVASLGEASYAVGSKASKSKLQTILNMRQSVGAYPEGVSEGVEISRLQRAERLIQQEFERRRGTGPPPPTLGTRDVLDLGLQPAVLTSKPSGISYLDAAAGDAPLVLPDTPPARGTDVASLASLDSQGPRSVRFHVGPQTLTDAIASVDSDSAALFGGASASSAEGFDAGGGSRARGVAGAAAATAAGGVGKAMRPVVVSTRRKKQERMAQLEQEADELRAREDKLSERVSDLVADFKETEDKGAALEAQRKLAQKKGREATAQKLVIEISINMQEMAETNKKIKEAQKEQYFLGLERERKEKLLFRLAEDLKEEKRRKALEAKIAAEIKNGGLLLPSVTGGMKAGVLGGSSSSKSPWPPQAESLASPVAAFQPAESDDASYAPAAPAYDEPEALPDDEQQPVDGVPAPLAVAAADEVVFPFEFDVYDMSQEDGSVGFQPTQATAADRRRMKRAAAAAAAASADDAGAGGAAGSRATGDVSSPPASSSVALPLLEEALREGLDSASAARRLSRGDPQRFAAAAAAATALRASLTSAEKAQRDGWRATSSSHRWAGEGGDKEQVMSTSTKEESDVSNMMTQMAFDILVQRGNDRSTVTLSGLLHMDLVNELLERGRITHHALQSMYREAGGSTGFGGLTLPQFETFLDLLAPFAEHQPTSDDVVDS